MSTTIVGRIIRFVAAPVAAAAFIGCAAVSCAAVANASPLADAPMGCVFTGGATQCQTPGNTQINADPSFFGFYPGQQYPYYGYFNRDGIGFHHHGFR